MTPAFPFSSNASSTNWPRIALQAGLAFSVAAILLFASSTTSRLHETERKIHSGATREPQDADPTAASIEIVLESSPLAHLSAGFVGIAPSMHMIRMTATRPLSNIDPIEHPARRRFGRIDFSFAFLVILPILLIPLCYVVYKSCLARGTIDKLLSGSITLFDFCVEQILLPVSAAAGFVFLITLACLYSSGLRVDSNELLARLSLWAAIVSIYLLAWMLLLTFFLLRASSFSVASIQYAAVFLITVIVLPQFMQSIQLSIERPKGRLPLVIERRLMGTEIQTEDRVGIDKFFQLRGFAALNWTEPLPKQQAFAIANLRIEERLAHKLNEFENNVRRLDDLALAGSWLSPFLVAQYGVDDLAGTGLSRYSRFRTDAIAFHEKWRNYTLPFLAKRQFLDFDALRSAPKFQFAEAEVSGILLAGAARSLYLGAIAMALGFAVRHQLRRILPKRRNAAR